MATLPRPSDSSADFVVVEAGIYKTVFTKYEGPIVSSFPNKDGSPKFQYKLFFQIVDKESEFDGEILSGYYGATMHPTMSKLYPVVKAMIGRDAGEDEELDLDDMLGNHVMWVVDNVTKTKDGITKTYANLVSASPMPKKKGSKPKPEPVVVVDDDDDEIVWEE